MERMGLNWTAEQLEEIVGYLEEAWGDWNADLTEEEWEAGYALLADLRRSDTERREAS